MGGFTWALAVWMWSRLPVGRPEIDIAHPWEFVLPPFGQWAEDEDLSRHPTIAYIWDNVKVFGGNFKNFVQELHQRARRTLLESGFVPLSNTYYPCWTT